MIRSTVPDWSPQHRRRRHYRRLLRLLRDIHPHLERAESHGLHRHLEWLPGNWTIRLRGIRFLSVSIVFNLPSCP